MGQKRAAKVAKRKAKKKKLAVLNKPRPVRSCGECSACCTVFKIKGIEGYDDHKPANTPCPNITATPDGSCSIYDTRPEGCVKYRCLWLRDLGVLHKSERPDKVGVIFNAPPMDHPVVKGVKARVVVARWVSPDFNLAAMQTVDRLVREGYVVIKVIGDKDYEIVAKDPGVARQVAKIYESLPAFSVLR